MAGEVVLRTFFGELLPPSPRSTSLAWLRIVQTVGWTGGLFAVHALSSTPEELPIAIVVVGSAWALAGLCLMALPETTGSEIDPEAEGVAQRYPVSS